MKTRIKFYAPLVLTFALSLVYLIFFFCYDWYVSDYQTLSEAFKSNISRNPRWITWGACASVPGLIVGFMLAIALLFSSSKEEYFEYFTEVFFDLRKEYLQRGFPTVRGIGLFIAFVIIGMLIVSQGGWRLGLRNGLEIIGIVIWVIFLITTLITIPILLIDIFYQKLSIVLFKDLFKKENDS